MILERYSNNSAALVPELSKMITKLPSDRRTTLQYACDLLSCLAVHSANTKMTTASLAMCIGPDLLRPSIDSLESALRIPQANEALAEIVAHYDEIFSERMLVRDANLLPTVSSSSQSPATSIDSSYNTSDANASAVAGNAPQSSLAIRPVTPPTTAAVAASPGLVPLPTLAPLPPLDLTGSPSPTHSSEASDSPTTPSRGAKPPVPAKPKVPPKPGAAASPAAAPSSPARAEAQSWPKHTGWASSSVSADSPHLKRAGVRLQTRDT